MNIKIEDNVNIESVNESDINLSIGTALKKLRIEHLKLTQSDLALKLQVKPTRISNFEMGLINNINNIIIAIKLLNYLRLQKLKREVEIWLNVLSNPFYKWTYRK